MKSIKLFFISFLYTSFLIGQNKIVNQYYVLDYPTSNIFSFSCSIPNLKNDPKIIGTNIKIDNSDLQIEKSYSHYFDDNSKTKSHNFLYNTWGHSNTLETKTEYFQVKHVLLKDQSWTKLNDQLFHVVEALRADSIKITIKKNPSDSVSSAAVEKIAGLFVGGTTVFGKILSAFGKNDSTSKAQNSLVKLTSNTKDSISFAITDSSVYFAVRYAQIGKEVGDEIVKAFFWRELAAPDCGTRIENYAPAIITDDLSNKSVSQLFRPAPCNVENKMKIKCNFYYDKKNNLGYVYVLSSILNSDVVNRSASATVNYDTVFISEPIDFINEYNGSTYADTYKFVFNQTAASSGALSDLVIIDFKLDYDPVSQKLKIYNRYGGTRGHYETRLIHKFANLKFLPR